MQAIAFRVHSWCLIGPSRRGESHRFRVALLIKVPRIESSAVRAGSLNYYFKIAVQLSTAYRFESS